MRLDKSLLLDEDGRPADGGEAVFLDFTCHQTVNPDGTVTSRVANVIPVCR